MKKGTRTRRMCKCGCGEPVPPYFDKEGRHRGYRKCLPGHRPPVTQKAREAWAASREALLKPLGTRRLHAPRTRPDAPRYWVVKVTARGRWKLEHRHLMEQHIGRPLRRDEHVHHINGDSLDNRLENLQLLTHREHAQVTGRSIVERGKGIWKYPICSECGWRHPPHA